MIKIIILNRKNIDEISRRTGQPKPDLTIMYKDAVSRNEVICFTIETTYKLYDGNQIWFPLVSAEETTS